MSTMLSKLSRINIINVSFRCKQIINIRNKSSIYSTPEFKPIVTKEYKTNKRKIQELKFKKSGDNESRTRNKKDKRADDPKNKKQYLTTGSPRDKEAAKVIIRKAMETNNQGIVQLIKPHKVETTTVFLAYKGLNLDENGLIIVGSKNLLSTDDKSNRTTKPDKDVSNCLILKIVAKDIARKQYSEYLSEKVTERMRVINPNLIRKQESSKRKKEDNDGFQGKIITIGWGITGNDLQGQKKFEIENLLKKGNNVQVILDNRKNLEKEISGGRRFINSEELTDLEKTKREKVIAVLENVLEDLQAQFETEGKIIDRVVYKITPDEKKELTKDERKELKRKEKEDRKEKMRLRKEANEKQMKEQIKILTDEGKVF